MSNDAKWFEEQLARDVGTMVGKTLAEAEPLTLEAVERLVRKHTPGTLDVTDARYDRDAQCIHFEVSGTIPGLQAWETDQPAVFIMARAAAVPFGVNVSPMDCVPEGQVWQLRGMYYVPPADWPAVMELVALMGAKDGEE